MADVNLTQLTKYYQKGLSKWSGPYKKVMKQQVKPVQTTNQQLSPYGLKLPKLPTLMDNG